MRILLTGASGMVGRNIQVHPTAKKYTWLTPSSTELNLLDYGSVIEYLKRYLPDVVVHAAGTVGGIQANIREPVRFLVDNLDMGRNVLLAAAAADIKKLINFGSSCMYPKDKQEALSEDDILTGRLEPTNEGYALAKITVAKLAEYLCRENTDLHYKTLIPCNLYGAYDKFDPKLSHMIPAVIHKLHQAKIKGIDSVEIWGSGEARREFLFAGDLADAVLKSIENIESLPSMMNIGLGYDYTVNQYYEIAAKIIGYQGAFYHDLSKPVGMQRKLSDTTNATAWGWKPKHSLERGLAATYQYYLKTLEGH